MRRTMWQLGEKLSQFGEYKLRKRLKFWRIQTEKEIENEELIRKPGDKEIWRIQTKIESICRRKKTRKKLKTERIDMETCAIGNLLFCNCILSETLHKLINPD